MGHDGSVAKAARCVQTGEPVLRCLEKERLPAGLDQGPGNLKMPSLARDMKASATIDCYLEKERLPAGLDKSLGNLKMPFSARDMKARAAVI